MPNEGSNTKSPLASRLQQAQQSTLRKNDSPGVARCQKKKHWIEIVLQDDEGEPIPDEQYLLVDPDGAEHKGNLDKNGFVRIDGLSPGTCSVRFPKLYEKWQPMWTSNLED